MCSMLIAESFFVLRYAKLNLPASIWLKVNALVDERLIGIINADCLNCIGCDRRWHIALQINCIERHKLASS